MKGTPNPSGANGTTGQPNASNGLKELDLMLPKACEALVLVAQCLVTILLQAEEAGSQEEGSDSGVTSAKVEVIKLRDIANQAIDVDGQGVVESLVCKCSSSRINYSI